MLIIPTDALWTLLERVLRREATGAAGGSSTFRKQMLTSRQMPCWQVEAAGRGVLKCSLTGRRPAPGAPAPQEDDPGRCEAQLHPLGAAPAFLPAGSMPISGSNQTPGPAGSSTPRRKSSPSGRRASKSSRGDRWRCASETIAPTKGSSPGRWRSTRRSCPRPPNGGCRL
jgi:hypothetical protein